MPVRGPLRALLAGRGLGGARGGPGSSFPNLSCPTLNPRAGAPATRLRQASERAVSGEPRASRPEATPAAGMAPAAASGGSSLPSGFSVFTTFPDLLFILEFVSGSRAPRGARDGWCCARGGSVGRR